MIAGILVGDALPRKNIWQVEKFKDKPVLLYSIEALQDSTLDEIILVLGKDYHRILNNIELDSRRIRIVMNRRYDRGLSSYVKAGIGMISPDCEGVMIVRGEFPLIKTSLIDKLITLFKNAKAGVFVPTYKKQLGQPYIFGKKYFFHIKRLTGNDIGTSIINRYPDDVRLVEVKIPGILIPVDKIDELKEFDLDQIDSEEKSETINVTKIAGGLKPLTFKPSKKSDEDEDSVEIKKKKANKKHSTRELSAGKKSKSKPIPEQKSGPPDLSLKMLNDLLSNKEKVDSDDQIKKDEGKDEKKKPSDQPKKNN